MRNAESVHPDRRKQLCVTSGTIAVRVEEGRSHAAFTLAVSSRLFADCFSARSVFFKRA
jgi:hypothetical protein